MIKSHEVVADRSQKLIRLVARLESDTFSKGQRANESASLTSNECSARGHEQPMDAITLMTRQWSVSLRRSGAVRDSGRTVIGPERQVLRHPKVPD